MKTSLFQLHDIQFLAAAAALVAIVTVHHSASSFDAKMLFMFLLLQSAWLLVLVGRVMTVEYDDDGDWPRSMKHNQDCETAVYTEHRSLSMEELTRQPEIHFHLDTQVCVTLITITWNYGHRRVCYSRRLRGPKSVHSGNGLPLIALRHLMSLPVSTPLLIVNHCWSGLCKRRYLNVETFNR